RGAISLLAQGDLVQLANTSLLSQGGSVQLRAERGSVTQAQGAVIDSGTSQSGNIVINAGTSIFVAGIRALSGQVALQAGGGSIIDASIADTGADIVAAGLALSASDEIGANVRAGLSSGAVNALEIAVTTLAASAAGTLRLNEADSIATGAVTVSVQNAGAVNNALTLTGLRSTDGGDIVLLAGSAASSGLLLSVGAGGVQSLLGTGAVNLSVLGATGRIDLRDLVRSGQGAVTLSAAGPEYGRHRCAGG
ncbi:MAG: hypothetical protein EBY28_25115, partial [Betaproteobacteria bacterium]|nr:hypothetical protein [Betaproteobacteria bacterium]